MKTLLEILLSAKAYLMEKKIPNPRREAEDLLGHALSLKRMDLYLQYDRPLIESEIIKYRDFIKRRSKGEPTGYIAGEMEFYDAFLKISKDVLIPRQETELLVDLIARDISSHALKNKVFVDVCTGSGCIAIAIKKKFPDLQVIGLDLSSKALSVAKNNAMLNQVSVDFIQSDGLLAYFGRADYLVSNPPYVTESEFGLLEEEVRLFEPKMALVSGPTGLEFFERFERELPMKLNSKAKIYFEIGASQAAAVKDIFSKPIWNFFKIEKDYSQKERFISLEFE